MLALAIATGKAAPEADRTGARQAVVAAVKYDAAKAKGIDGTLRTFAHTPLGLRLSGVVATGFVLFGGHSVCEGCWHRGV